MEKIPRKYKILYTGKTFGHCTYCEKPTECEWHHMIYGANRRRSSDYYNLVCKVCPDCHREIHKGNTVLQDVSKRQAQRKFERIHSRKEFMEVFGRNYLDD